MKIRTTHLLSFFLGIIISVGNLASQSQIEKLFNKAEEYYNDDKLDSALITFQEITKKFPKHKLYPRAFYNVGYTAWRIEEFDVAIPVFEKILKSNFNDKEKGPGEGIMSEPYAIYKHRSSAILSDIYLSKAEYSKSLEYLILADKVHPYQHFCGNEYAANDIYTATQYSKIYDGLGQTDSSIVVLWNHIFYYGLAHNRIAVDQMKIVLLKKYDSLVVKQELLNAEQRITIKLEKEHEYGYITIFDHEIPLPEDLWPIPQTMKFDDYINLSGLEKYKAIYKDSEFYRAFTN